MDLMFIRRRSDLFEPSHQPRENARRRCDGHGEGVAWRLTGIVLIDNPPPRRKASHYRLDSDISGDRVVIGTCRIAGVTLAIHSYRPAIDCGGRIRDSGARRG